MTPRMRLTLAELLDRFTIEMRKSFYGHGNEQLLMEVEQEMWMQVSNICNDDKKTRAMMDVIRAAAKLGVHNADIANLEWQLRQGQKLSYEEQGRRALAIRKINDGGRVAAKADLSAALEQNVETRHYGYADDMKAEDLTLDVQEPVKQRPQNGWSEQESLKNQLNGAGFNIPSGATITGIGEDPVDVENIPVNIGKKFDADRFQR